MRMTQFIGLSNEATEFLKKNESKVISMYHMTDGLCEEPVSGNIYQVLAKSDYLPDDERLYVEVIQMKPWSSGPMIFTCLMEVPSGRKVFEWDENDIANML